MFISTLLAFRRLFERSRGFDKDNIAICKESKATYKLENGAVTKL